MRTRSTALMLSLLASFLIFPAAASAQDSAEICTAEELVEAIESGPEEGTIAGMADDPVGTAASNNPVLTTLVTAASAAGLVDTLNAAEALTVFAPTDCAFAQLDQATLDAALADPSGLLTTVLGFHVIAGERLTSADVAGDYEAFTGEPLTVEGTTVAGQAEILVPDVETANATVHLIDTVMLPPSVTDAAQEGDEEMAEGDEEPAEEGTEEPVDAEAAEGDDAEEADAEEADAEEADAEEADAEEADAEEADAEEAAPTGGVAAGAGGANAGSAPLVAMGLLAMLALGGAVVARRRV